MPDDERYQEFDRAFESFIQEWAAFILGEFGHEEDDEERPETGVVSGWTLSLQWEATDGDRWFSHAAPIGQSDALTLGLRRFAMLTIEKQNE